MAYYGAYSGKTSLDGITAEMIFYDHDNPPIDIKDKIVVIPTRKHPSKPYSTNYLTNFTYNEYEYVLDGDTLPEPFEFVDPEISLLLIFGINLHKDLIKFQKMEKQLELSLYMTWHMTEQKVSILFLFLIIMIHQH